MTSENPLTVERSVVRRRKFKAHNLDEVIKTLAELSRQDHTGPVTINMSQGAFVGVVAEDRATLPA